MMHIEEGARVQLIDGGKPPVGVLHENEQLGGLVEQIRLITHIANGIGRCLKLH